MRTTRFPASVDELAERLAGAPGPSEDDQSRAGDGTVLDSREAVERFLAEIDQVRGAGSNA